MSQHKLIPARTIVGNQTVSGTLTVGGQILAADGTAAAPGYAFTTEPDTGLYLVAANALGISSAGTGRWQVNASGHILAIADNTYDIGASGATRPRTGHFGTSLVLAGTTTISSGQFAVASGTICQLGTVGGQAIRFYTTNTYRWDISPTGHWDPATANTYDIGPNGSARSIYVGTSIILSGGVVGTSGVGVLALGNGTVPSTSPADTVQLFSVDLSAGNATLGIRTETAVAAEVAVSTHTLSIKINGATYRMLMTNA